MPRRRLAEKHEKDKALRPEPIGISVYIHLSLAWVDWDGWQTDATYSPCSSLKMFFTRSMTRRHPFGNIEPTSPDLSQPSAVKASRLCM